MSVEQSEWTELLREGALHPAINVLLEEGIQLANKLAEKLKSVQDATTPF